MIGAKVVNRVHRRGPALNVDGRSAVGEPSVDRRNRSRRRGRHGAAGGQGNGPDGGAAGEADGEDVGADILHGQIREAQRVAGVGGIGQGIRLLQTGIVAAPRRGTDQQQAVVPAGGLAAGGRAVGHDGGRVRGGNLPAVGDHGIFKVAVHEEIRADVCRVPERQSDVVDVNAAGGAEVEEEVGVARGAIRGDANPVGQRRCGGRGVGDGRHEVEVFGDGVGSELFLDELLRAHGGDVFDVGGRRTVSQPIENIGGEERVAADRHHGHAVVTGGAGIGDGEGGADELPESGGKKRPGRIVCAEDNVFLDGRVGEGEARFTVGGKAGGDSRRCRVRFRCVACRCMREEGEND